MNPDQAMNLMNPRKNLSWFLPALLPSAAILILFAVPVFAPLLAPAKPVPSCFLLTVRNGRTILTVYAPRARVGDPLIRIGERVLPRTWKRGDPLPAWPLPAREFREDGEGWEPL